MKSRLQEALDAGLGRMPTMSTSKILLSLNVTAILAAVSLAWTLYQRIDAFALRCQVDASYMRGRAADMDDAAQQARDVANRYLAMAEANDGVLSTLNERRLQQKWIEEADRRAQATAYRDAATVVCLNPEAMLD